MQKITIVLADDHVLVRNGIKAMLESDPDLAVVGEAGTGEDALAAARKLRPDILVLDIRMPAMTGLEAVALLRDYSAMTRAVILSMHDSEEYVLQALHAGAFGYLLKDADKEEFIRALKQVNAGRKYFGGSISNILANRVLGGNTSAMPAQITPVNVDDRYQLTRREREILRMIVQGRNNRDIADVLDKSLRTVETHRFNIMKKLAVNNATDLVNKAIRENLI